MLNKLTDVIFENQTSIFDKIVRDELESYGYSVDELIADRRVQIEVSYNPSTLHEPRATYRVTVDETPLFILYAFSDIETEETPNGPTYRYVTNWGTQDLTGKK